jgi:hypothetical protein
MYHSQEQQVQFGHPLGYKLQRQIKVYNKCIYLMKVATEQNERSSDPHKHTNSQHSQCNRQSPDSTVASQTADQMAGMWNIEDTNLFEDLERRSSTPELHQRKKLMYT